jgi:hypothetical protein
VKKKEKRKKNQPRASIVFQLYQQGQHNFDERGKGHRKNKGKKIVIQMRTACLMMFLKISHSPRQMEMNSSLLTISHRKSLMSAFYSPYKAL